MRMSRMSRTRVDFAFPCKPDPLTHTRSGTHRYREYESMRMHTLVVNGTDVRFYINDGVLISSFTIARPITDCVGNLVRTWGGWVTIDRMGREAMSSAHARPPETLRRCCAI